MPDDDQNTNDQVVRHTLGLHGYSPEDLEQFHTPQSIAELYDAYTSMQEEEAIEELTGEERLQEEEPVDEPDEEPDNSYRPEYFPDYLMDIDWEKEKKKWEDPQKHFRHALNINVKDIPSEDEDGPIQYEIAIQLEIKEQPKEMTATEGTGLPKLLFTSTTGWRIITHNSVRIFPRHREIHIKGREKGLGTNRDSHVFATECPFPAVVQNIQEALLEFAEFANQGRDNKIPNPNQSRYDALEIED